MRAQKPNIQDILIHQQITITKKLQESKYQVKFVDLFDFLNVYYHHNQITIINKQKILNYCLQIYEHFKKKQEK